MTLKRRWPAATDYIDAMQHPAHVFGRPELRDARFDLDLFGIPDGCTGSNAIVFKANLGQRTAALRCFTSQAGLSRERYLALGRHWQTEPERRRWMVPAIWWDDALRVTGDQWPLVEMEWVTGRPLDVYVGYLCEARPAALLVLADAWLQMLRDLAAARVAHGDLQHGNVLIDEGSSLRLVDLDSAWAPDMDGLEPPDEAGHQAFRHPSRPRTDSWGPFMDTFPGLVVLTTLKALAHQPALWRSYHNGDNLIFVAGDFVAVDRTPLWADLSRTSDPEVAKLVRLLKRCCDDSWRPTGTVDALIESREEMAQPTSFAPPTPRATPTPMAPEAPPPAPSPPEEVIELLDWQVELPASATTPVAPVSLLSAGVSGGSATSLPPPPAVQSPKIYAPVANPVAISASPTPGGNPFSPPPSRGPVVVPAATPQSNPQQAPKMPSRVMGWAVVALILGGVLFGLPAILIALRADSARAAGDLQRAAKLSRRSKRWSVVVVVIMTIFIVAWIVLSSIAAGQRGY